jgi:phosphoglucomutase
MVAREGRSLRELLERLYSEVGRFITRRENITLSSDAENVFHARMQAIPAAFGGVRVREVVTLDGVKCLLDDGSWLLFRKSGTEPVVRLYGEASSEERLITIMAAGRQFVLG